MKNLLDKIFKKEPQFNYIIAEYQPTKIKLQKNNTSIFEYAIDQPTDRDEMQIDNIHQCS